MIEGEAVGRKPVLDAESGVLEDSVHITERVFPAVPSVQAVSGKDVPDGVPVNESQHIGCLGCIWGGEDQCPIGLENPVDLTKRFGGILHKVFQDLTEEHNVKGGVFVWKLVVLYVEVVELERNHPILAARLQGHCLLARGITGAEVVRCLQIELREIGEQPRGEVRVCTQFQGLALEVLGQTPRVEKSPERVDEVPVQGSRRGPDDAHGLHGSPHLCL